MRNGNINGNGKFVGGLVLDTPARPLSRPARRSPRLRFPCTSRSPLSLAALAARISRTSRFLSALAHSPPFERSPG